MLTVRHPCCRFMNIDIGHSKTNRTLQHVNKTPLQGFEVSQ